ncbi:MAG TPA: PKD domain-containing protein, partial [Solirubrobacteraceae bacterium]|nr:PKD domain-containing protein [Solirubrobacteraceae bacterium]
ASIDNPFTPNYNSKSGREAGGQDLNIYTAGSPITQLTNGTYAARYGLESATPVNDYAAQAQVIPWDEPIAPLTFWIQGSGETNGVANMGIRLFAADGELIDTLGGAAQGKKCNLDFAQLSVAAGAEGALFALSQPNLTNGDEGDEIVEFAPAAAGDLEACPAPSGQIEVNGKVVTPENGEPVAKVTVFQEAPVEFNAISIERAGESPFAFEWNFTGAKTGEPELKSEMVGQNSYLWPTPVATHKYTEATAPGKYDEASVQVYGSYGKSTFPVDVRVVGTSPPIAKLTAPTEILAGQEVTFEGGESTATPGYKIENYQWEFGEVGVEPENTGTVAHAAHAFAAAGEYTVKLRITDEAKHTSAPAEARVKVAAAGNNNNGGGSNGGGTSGNNTSGNNAGNNADPGDTGPGVQSPKSIVKPPLTEAQKLHNALAACKKERKSKRVGCDKRAYKLYGKKAAKKTSKKRK